MSRERKHIPYSDPAMERAWQNGYGVGLKARPKQRSTAVADVPLSRFTFLLWLRDVVTVTWWHLLVKLRIADPLLSLFYVPKYNRHNYRQAALSKEAQT